MVFLRILTITGCLFFATTILLGQNTSSSSSEDFYRSSTNVTRHIIDSTINSHHQLSDSLKKEIASVFFSCSSRIRLTGDSLFLFTEKVLNPARIDSLKQLQTFFLQSLQDCQVSQQNTIDYTLMCFHKNLEAYSFPHEQTSLNREGDILNDFYSVTDSLSQMYRDSLIDVSSDITSHLTDTTNSFCDSLSSFVDMMMDYRELELDSIERHSSHLILWADAHSFTSYHGRDGGVQQASVSPTILYRHTSGMSIGVSTTWFEQQAQHWSGTALSVAYDYFFSPTLEASLSYSHFWFDSSNTEFRSVFNNSLDAEIDISTSLGDIGLLSSLDLGKQSEYSFQVSMSYPINVKRNIVLTPTVNGVWGEQNAALVALRQTLVQKQNKKGKTVSKTVTTKASSTKNIFSVLNYEISLPASIRIGRLELLPSITLVFPENVEDGSRSTPFLDAGLLLRWDKIF